MIALLKKEINSFFSTLTGYIVISVFLLINSLIMWVFPGEMNVLNSGYAGMDSLFIMAPWVFLILIPAITMRMFSEEKKSGTLDLLLTRPKSDLIIILSKYFAGIVIVLFSLIPTLIYLLTIIGLGDPVGNIDFGATWGSYTGLFLLASVYIAIGLFTSSITSNIIVSFLLSILFSFILLFGFESISILFTFSKFGQLLAGIGIYSHYNSLSRGVIYFKDVVYFISVAIIFILFTKYNITINRR